MKHSAPTPKVFNAKYQSVSSSRPALPKGLGKPLIIAAVVIVGFLLISKLPIFRVSSVEVDGEISAESNRQLTGLVGQSIFSGRIEETTKSILNSDSTIGSLNCARSIPAKLLCKAEARKGVLTWNANGKSYLIDSYGVAFEGEANSELLTVEDSTSAELKVGDLVISSSTIEGLQSMAAQLSEKEFKLDKILVSTSLYQFEAVISGRTKIELPFPTKSPITVAMTTSYPTSAQVKVLEQLVAQRSPEIAGRVDLRVPGNVYYR